MGFMNALQLVDRLEELIRRDPAGRGLVGSEDRHGALCPGHLRSASAHLAVYGRRVAIVTGFYIPMGQPAAAETDGPPGALLLADSLLRAGIETWVITDRLCMPAVAAAAREYGYEASRLLCYPFPPGANGANRQSAAADEMASWRETLLRGAPGGRLTHLVAVERVGPSHTLESLAAQSRSGPAPMEEFLAQVPEAQRNRCHNMRGEPMDSWAGDLHLLFEEAPSRVAGIKTIGIGDGGNEIGMGSIPWEQLQCRLAGPQSGRVPCRVACNWNIVAGTSNWGACALAAAALAWRGQARLLARYDSDLERRVLQRMVDEGPAVDGVSRRREASVDGLPLLTYLQPWQGMRAALGLPN